MNKRRLLIVGAGDFGRELFSWINLAEPNWSDCVFGGFVDDNLHALDSYPHYPAKVVDTVHGYEPRDDDVLVMAVSKPATKLIIGESLETRGATFRNFVHPSVRFGKYVQLGRGVVICPSTIISCDVVVGDFVLLNVNCTLGHDVKLGRGCTVSPYSCITGFAELDDGVFLGSHASILPRAKVGAFATVGAGSVVLRKVLPGATVMGVPAKQILP